MVDRNKRSKARKRGLATAAGLGFAVSAVALSTTAESPAIAAEHGSQQTFEQAFAPFDLTDAEAGLLPEAALAAQTRFDEAPVSDLPKSSLGTYIGSGTASYYGAGFAGRPTASGERFNPSALTAAHRSLPFGTRLKVTNPRNGRSVVVRINDRGPFSRSRVIDLSHEAARQIGLVQQGHGPVQLASVAS